MAKPAVVSTTRQRLERAAIAAFCLAVAVMIWLDVSGVHRARLTEGAKAAAAGRRWAASHPGAFPANCPKYSPDFHRACAVSLDSVGP